MGPPERGLKPPSNARRQPASVAPGHHHPPDFQPRPAPDGMRIAAWRAPSRPASTPRQQHCRLSRPVTPTAPPLPHGSTFAPELPRMDVSYRGDPAALHPQRFKGISRRIRPQRQAMGMRDQLIERYTKPPTANGANSFKPQPKSTPACPSTGRSSSDWPKNGSSSVPEAWTSLR